MPTEVKPATLRALIDRLGLDRKVELLSGASAWATHGNAEIGLRRIVMSDGPSGVRGELWDERSPSLMLPSATALAASWDIDLARRYGAMAAQEARRKDVNVILGPTVNLHRSPLGGRSFEAYSEDPVLTAEIAAAYITGVQSTGVAATVKHFVANDSETDRFTVDVQLSERALREVYLLPFEKAVMQAGVWLVMSAYNSVNGTTATETELLTHPLTSEWGFDGVVVSDWTAVRSVHSARGRQDIAMPGPHTAWGQALIDAVCAGEVDETSIDAKLERILRLAARVGALGEKPPAPLRAAYDAAPFARYAAAEGMVLVRNVAVSTEQANTAPALPLEPSVLTRIAVIGHNAQHARAQGGGSATVISDYVVSPLAGLRAATPESVAVDYALGAVVQSGIAVFERGQITNPVTGEAGAHVSYRDVDNREIFAEDRFAGFIIEFGENPRNLATASLVFDTTFHPGTTGPIGIGFAAPGTCRMFVDDALVLDATIPPSGADQVGSFFSPESRTANVNAVAGLAIRLRFEFEPGEIIDDVPGSFTVWFGTEPAPHDSDALIDEAVRVARAAEVAIIVVGTNSQVECEGYDRRDLLLPGRQNDLVKAVAAANPNTIVVVNAGAPVEMPWRNDVAAILLTWFGGQEFGNALADVIYGVAEPGGRLPTTWPVALTDVPVWNVTPQDGVLRYDEGIHIGYRAWLKAGIEPAYPFGFGLGYSRWELGTAVVAEVDTGAIRISLDVSNVGDRAGKQVVQVYARRRNSRTDRPRLWLVGFGVARAAAGRVTTLAIEVPRRAFAYWENDGWVYESGEYELLVATSSADLAPPITVALSGAEDV